MVAALPLIGLGLTVAAGGMQYSAAQAANRARSRATANWVNYQKEKSQKQAQADEANRKKAQMAQEEGLNKLGDAQNTVDTETQRLSQELGSDNPANQAAMPEVNDALLSGQGNDPNYKVYAAQQINKAAKDSRAKTAALAAMMAYTNSQKGLGRTNAETLAQSGQAIDLYGNMRRGDLATYGVARGVSPLQPNEGGGSGIGTIMANVGGQLAGGGFGGKPLAGDLSAMF